MFLFSLLQSWALNKSQESTVSSHVNRWFHGATRIWNCDVFFLEDQCSYCAGAQVQNHDLCVLCCSWELKILKVAFFHARNEISNTRRELSEVWDILAQLPRRSIEILWHLTRPLGRVKCQRISILLRGNCARKSDHTTSPGASWYLQFDIETVDKRGISTPRTSR